MTFRIFGLTILLLGLAACAGLPRSQDAVRVTVADIRVLEATLLEQLYEVTLRIQNRQDRALSIQGGSFDLELNGKDFGSGVTDARVTVAPYSDTKIDVRMVSTLFGMLRLFQSLQDSSGGVLEYEIAGRFSVEGRFGGIGFHESGEVALPARPVEGGRERD
jgi:LEA14-like dessication related protein